MSKVWIIQLVYSTCWRAGACPCELALSVTTIAAKWSKTYPAVGPSQGPCHGSRWKCWKPRDCDREPWGHHSWCIGTNVASRCPQISQLVSFVAKSPGPIVPWSVCHVWRVSTLITWLVVNTLHCFNQLPTTTTLPSHLVIDLTPNTQHGVRQHKLRCCPRFSWHGSFHTNEYMINKFSLLWGEAQLCLP